MLDAAPLEELLEVFIGAGFNPHGALHATRLFIQFPRLRSLATVLATYDGAAELDEGLDIVIAGLRSQLLT